MLNTILLPNKKQDSPPLATSESEEAQSKQCKICYQGEETSFNNPLVSPCLCKGSIQYIHERCLSEFMRYSPICTICRADLLLNGPANSNWLTKNVLQANPLDLMVGILDILVKYVMIIVLIANYNVVFDNKEVIDEISIELLNYIVKAFIVMLGVYFIMGIYYLVLDDYVIIYQNSKKKA